MTNTIATAQLKAAISYLEREVSSALLKALSAVLGEGLVTAGKTEPATLPENCFCVEQKFDGLDNGWMRFALMRPSAITLGERLLKAKAPEASGEEQAIAALKEAFTQAGGGLAGSFSARVKREIRRAGLKEEAAPTATDQSIAIKLAVENETFDVIAWASPELFELLPVEVDSVQNALVPVTAVAARNLDLLLDVEMPVSISFGRAQLPLKDVFKLTIGSMVELNRAISEPVEVIVNNSVIAQGEVVVVEGNFGVRITHVMSKHDRIRSLT